MINRFTQKGQGLLEAVIAIGVLLTAIIIIISLSIASTDLSSANELKTLATNLAREGIESIRQQRDSNWLAGVEFYKNITPGDTFADPIAVVFDPGVNQFLFQSASWLGNNNCYQNANCTCYTDPVTCKIFFLNGVYAQWLGQGSDETPFYRLVFINLFESDGSPTVTAGSLTSEMQVISQVYWLENGTPRNVTLATTLYDWQTNNE